MQVSSIARNTSWLRAATRGGWGLCALLALMVIPNLGLTCPGNPPPSDPGCATDADCDDGRFCNGEETCDVGTNGADGTCVDGTAPCPAEECVENADFCPECFPESEAEDCDDQDECTDDVCNDQRQCENVNNTATCDDGDDCTSNDACADGACAGEPNTEGCDDGDACTTDDACSNGECTGTPVECDEDETCNPATGECEGDVPPGFAVSIDGCPESAGSGDSITLTASTVNDPDGANIAFEFEVTAGNSTIGTNGAGSDSAEVIAGSQASTVTVTAFNDLNTNGVADAGEESATDECSFDVAFSAELQVDAGGLIPGRASLANFNSGAPGTAGNNALNGSVNQQGVDPDAIAVIWEVVSQPTGSGTVTFSNPSEPDTAFTVNPPASAGTYVFSLTATNENTSETASDTVTFELFDAPVVAVKPGFPQMRQNVLRNANTNGAEVTLQASFDAAGSITIYDGLGVANANIITSVAVPAGDLQDVVVSLPIDGTRVTANPNTYLLTFIATDPAGSNALANLTDPTQRASIQQFALYISDAQTTTADASTVPIIDLNSQVGRVDGSGSPNITHQGVGVGNPALDCVPRQLQVADINDDGFGDLCALQENAGGVQIRYGAPDLVTQDAVATNADGWGAVDVTIDATAQYYDAFATGDFDNDGDVDVVTIDNNQTASAVQVFLLGGAGTGSTVNTASRAYAVANADIIDTGLNKLALGGDVSGDGIADIVLGLPGASSNFAAAGTDDGAVVIIYGKANLPSNANLEANTVTGENPAGQFNGELIIDDAAAEADLWGSAATIGQFNGGGGLDLWAAEAAGEDDIRLYTGGGGSRIATAVQRTFNQPAAGNMALGALRIGDVTGDGAADLVILSHVTDIIYFGPNSAADNANVVSFVQYTGATQVNGTAWAANGNEDIELALINDDTTNDIVFGDDNSDRVLVIRGPVGLNNVVQGDFFRSFNDGDTNVGTNIAFGDVNGDGLTDWLFGDGDNTQAIVGLN